LTSLNEATILRAKFGSYRAGELNSFNYFYAVRRGPMQ